MIRAVLDLGGRAALVTGGSGGIGFTIASALAQSGARVALSGRDRASLAASAAKIGDRAEAFPADLRSPAEAERLVADAVGHLGRLDILVNAAGVGTRKTALDLDMGEWDEMVDTNLRATFVVCRSALPFLRQTRGYVLTVASRSGKVGRALNSAYCASKFGVVGLMEALQEEELQHGVRFTSLCPGRVATRMVDERDGLGAPLPTEDMARTVLWLLSLSSDAVVRDVVIVPKSIAGRAT